MGTKLARHSFIPPTVPLSQYYLKRKKLAHIPHARGEAHVAEVRSQRQTRVDLGFKLRSSDGSPDLDRLWSKSSELIIDVDD